MALMVELHDMKDLNKRLQHDLDTANEKLHCVTEENTCLLAINQDLRRELVAARTGSTTHGKDNLFSVAAGSSPEACFSDVIMVPNTTQLSVVAKGDATHEHISERMDVDTDAGMDICEIPAMCYKTKWYSAREPVNEIGWIFPAETLRQLPGLKKIDATMLFGKSFQRLGDTAKDESGNSIAGFFVILDMIHALFFAHRNSARTWCGKIQNINKIIAPSLTSIPNGHSNGGKQYVASYVDALRIIVGKCCKMTGVVCEIDDALVDGERVSANVDDLLAKCEVVSFSVHHQRKIESQRLGEKEKAACDLHDGSVPCVVCKGKISDYGYRQHCIQCYIDLFPGIRHEELVRSVIDANFEGFVHNKVMKGSGGDNECRRKIDHRLQIGNTILAIETDERAHADRNQEDEKRRYNEFTSNFPHKFVFIRFNPHTNMEDKLAETDFKHKLGVLMRSIKSQMLRIRVGSNVKKLEIFTLFCG